MLAKFSEIPFFAREVLSVYLSRLLGIGNVPVVSLAAVKPNLQGMWSRQTVKDLIALKWEVNTTVAFIQWIENLERIKCCGSFCRQPKNCLTATLCCMVQWETMVVS